MGFCPIDKNLKRSLLFVFSHRIIEVKIRIWEGRFMGLLGKNKKSQFTANQPYSILLIQYNQLP